MALAMGVTCSLHRATASEVQRLRADPDEVVGFLEGNGSAPQTREVRPKGVFGWLLRLTPITITEVVPESEGGTPIDPPDPDRSIEIEKAWHGLHFLLTGLADGGEEPACYFMRGGEDLDDEGQSRALGPDQVRRLSEYLSSLTAADLAQRFDPERMTTLKIYPSVIWKRADPSESPLEWLTASFEEVRRFIAKAAAAGDGVVINIS
jgi:Domain of unknown function (DUF1877)